MRDLSISEGIITAGILADQDEADLNLHSTGVITQKSLRQIPTKFYLLSFEEKTSILPSHSGQFVIGTNEFFDSEILNVRAGHFL